MSGWQPCKRREFIKRLRNLGFDGPFSGTRHQFMIFEKYRLTVSSTSEYSIPQLRMMINEVEGITGKAMTADEWDTLG